VIPFPGRLDGILGDYSQFKVIDGRLDGLHVKGSSITVWEVKEDGA
jgi:hypothetical protein